MTSGVPLKWAGGFAGNLHVLLLLLLGLTDPLASQGVPWVIQGWGDGEVRLNSVDIRNGRAIAVGRAEHIVIDRGPSLPASFDSSSYALTIDESGEPLQLYRGAFSPHDVPSAAYSGVVGPRGRSIVGEGIGIVADGGMWNLGAFVVNAYEPDGTSPWTFSVFDEEIDPLPAQRAYVKGLALAPTGDVYMTGEFLDSMTVVGGPTIYGDGIDVFVARLDSTGALQWINRIGGPGADFSPGDGPRGILSSDDSGNMVLAGRWVAGAVVGSQDGNEFVLSDQMSAVIRYNRDGQLDWVLTESDLGVEGRVEITNVATSRDGSFWVTWRFGEVDGEVRVSVGDTSLSDTNAGGSFITRYDASGNLEWIRQLKGTPGGLRIWDVDTDGQGTLFVVGSFGGTLRAQNRFVGRPADATDGFALAYDRPGRLIWFGQARGPGDQRIQSLGVDPGTNLVVGGEFTGTVEFDGHELSAVGARNIFVAHVPASRITGLTLPAVPESTSDLTNYPNPFARTTTVEYHLERAQHVRIDIFDLLGRKVTTLVDEARSPGTHVVDWDASETTPGVYVCRLSYRDTRVTGTEVLIHASP